MAVYPCDVCFKCSAVIDIVLKVQDWASVAGDVSVCLCKISRYDCCYAEVMDGHLALIRCRVSV